MWLMTQMYGPAAVCKREFAITVTVHLIAELKYGELSALSP